MSNNAEKKPELERETVGIEKTTRKNVCGWYVLHLHIEGVGVGPFDPFCSFVFKLNKANWAQCS